MSKKPGIPTFTMEPGSIFRALQAIKTNVETITGARGRPIEQLDDTVTTADIIDKINEIIVRLNARGQ